MTLARVWGVSPVDLIDAPDELVGTMLEVLEEENRERRRAAARAKL